MEKLKMDLKYHKLSLLIRLIVNIAAILRCIDCNCGVYSVPGNSEYYPADV